MRIAAFVSCLVACGGDPSPDDVRTPCLASCEAQADGCPDEHDELLANCSADCPAYGVAWCAQEWIAVYECEADLTWTCVDHMTTRPRAEPVEAEPCPEESEALLGCQWAHDG